MRLALLRHAKAAAETWGSSDHERPLLPEGQEGARLIGKWLADEVIYFDLVVCSTAKRTTETCNLIFEGKDVNVHYVRSIYLGGMSALQDVIAETPERVESLLVVAHNPDVHDLARWLSNKDDIAGRGQLVNFPPATLAIFNLPLMTWGDLRPGCGELKHLVKPADVDQNFRS